MLSKRSSSLFTLCASCALAGCSFSAVSTNTPDPDSDITDNVDQDQAETAMGTAVFPGPRWNVISEFNDFSLGQVNGGPEYDLNAAGDTRVQHKGFSLMGWATSGDGQNWTYHGKVRPPEGWWSIFADPSVAVDSSVPYAAYMVQMGMSEAAFNLNNPDPTALTQPLIDGFCIARSIDAGETFGVGDGVNALTPRVAHCEQTQPTGTTGDTNDLTAATVDWLGRIWVAMEDRKIDRIRIWRSQDATTGWNVFTEMLPCSQSSTLDCIPDDQLAFIGNREPLLRSAPPCTLHDSDDCLTAPNAGQAVFLGSVFSDPVTLAPDLRLIEFGSQRVDTQLACTGDAQCAVGQACQTFGSCACQGDADCPAGQSCQGGLCTGQCATALECPLQQCVTGGSCTCAADADCSPAQQCTGGTCQLRSCAIDADCPTDNWRCLQPGDPEVLAGASANFCGQVLAWGGISLTSSCELGTNGNPAVVDLNGLGKNVVIGANAAALEFSVARRHNFDVGEDNLGVAQVLFAYQFRDGDGRLHIQGAEFNGLGQCLVHGLERTDLAAPNDTCDATGANCVDQQFQPTVDFAELNPDPGLRWQAAYYSNHNVVDPNDRYLDATASTIDTQFGVPAFVSFQPLGPGPQTGLPSDNYACSPGVTPPPQFNLPKAGDWGDYFGITQALLDVNIDPLPSGPTWMNIGTYTYSAARPLGSPSPCKVEQVFHADPRHVNASTWPSISLFP